MQTFKKFQIKALARQQKNSSKPPYQNFKKIAAETIIQHDFPPF
jgi:hypothetical protein